MIPSSKFILPYHSAIFVFQLYWDTIDIQHFKFKCTTWSFDTCSIYCKMLPQLVNKSFTSHNYHFLLLHPSFLINYFRLWNIFIEVKFMSGNHSEMYRNSKSLYCSLEHSIVSQLYFKNKTTYRKRNQICSYQRQRAGRKNWMKVVKRCKLFRQKREREESCNIKSIILKAQVNGI